MKKKEGGKERKSEGNWKSYVYGLIARYLILIALAIGNLYVFYFIFTPLTVYPVYFVLKAMYGEAVLRGNIIFLKLTYLELIPACIAGAAYYLLLILNMTTPMKLKKRARSLSFLFLSFLVLNILRIVIFSWLYVTGIGYFDLAHKVVWYAGSTGLVVLIWFANVWLFRIKEIPVYSDVKWIIGKMKEGKGKGKKKIWKRK